MITHGLPGNENAACDTFGTPYHGLYSSSGLPLPNGVVKQFPAMRVNPITQLEDPCPTNLSGHRPGDVSIVRVPGHVLKRAPEDMALDAAQGVNWFDYAVISGRDRHLYGSKLGPRCWLYAVAPGEIWKIDMGAQPVSGLLSFTVQRFGDMTGLSDGAVRTVSVPFPDAAALGISIDRYGIMFTELCGHAADGHVAAVGLGLTLENAGSYDRGAPYPEAYVSVSINGSGTKEAISISASVYMTRQNAIQYSETNNDHINTYATTSCSFGFYYESYVYAGITEANRTGFTENGHHYDYNNYYLTRNLRGTTFPDGLSHPDLAPFPYANGVPEIQSFNGDSFVRYSGENTVRIERQSNRVMWIMVDPAGGFHEVEGELYYRLDNVQIRAESDELGTEVSGQDTNYGGIVRSVNGTFTHTYSRFTGTEEKLELRLKIAGAVVDKYTTRSKTGTQSSGRLEYAPGPWNDNRGSIISDTITSNNINEQVMGGHNVTSVSVSSKAIPNAPESLLGHAFNYFCLDDQLNKYWPYIYLYSNNLVGIIEGHFPDKSEAGMLGPYASVYLAIADIAPVTFQGIFSYKGQVTGGGEVQPSTQSFSTWQPMSGEFSVLNSAPVVYL